MAGKVVKVIPITEFDYTGIVSAGGTSTATVVKQIDVSKYTQLDLVARLHSATWPSQGNDKIKIEVVQDGYSSEEPQTPFIGSKLADAEFIETTDTVPDLKVDTSAGGPPLGSMVAVRVTGTRASASQDDLKMTVSADIVLRE